MPDTRQPNMQPEFQAHWFPLLRVVSLAGLQMLGSSCLGMRIPPLTNLVGMMLSCCSCHVFSSGLYVQMPVSLETLPTNKPPYMYMVELSWLAQKVEYLGAGTVSFMIVIL